MAMITRMIIITTIMITGMGTTRPSELA
jgi:hypothetical protein